MNILLLNGGKQFGHSNGKLNNTLHETAKETLKNLGHTIKNGHCTLYTVHSITLRTRYIQQSLYHFVLKKSHLLERNFCRVKLKNT